MDKIIQKIKIRTIVFFTIFASLQMSIASDIPENSNPTKQSGALISQFGEKIRDLPKYYRENSMEIANPIFFGLGVVTTYPSIKAIPLLFKYPCRSSLTLAATFYTVNKGVEYLNLHRGDCATNFLAGYLISSAFFCRGILRAIATGTLYGK